jgi:hypothetical protein
MNTSRSKPLPNPPHRKTLTFGDFVAGGCRAWGEREAVGFIRLVVKVRWVEFGGPQRLVIS